MPQSFPSSVRETAQFSYDYFTGSNIGLYIREILIGTAVGVEFSLVQNKRPVWGYASQLWDGVAHGTVQCSGFLMINFQYAQFLPTLIARTHGLDVQSDFYTSKYEKELGESAQRLVNPSDPNHLRQDRDTLKRRFWGGDADSELTRQQALSSTSLARPDDHYYPFDIHVTYGDAFGNQLRSQDSQPSFTLSAVRTLRQVQLTGFGQTITVEGEPVLEQYPFICREVT